MRRDCTKDFDDYNLSSLCGKDMTLLENIAAREVLRSKISNLDRQLTDLTLKESKIAHEMRVSKNYELITELEEISKKYKALRSEIDVLDRKLFSLIRDSLNCH